MFRLLLILSLSSCGDQQEHSEKPEENSTEENSIEVPIKVKYSRLLTDTRKWDKCEEDSRYLMSDDDYDSWVKLKGKIVSNSESIKEKTDTLAWSWDKAVIDFFAKTDRYICRVNKLVEKYCGATDWAYQPEGC